MFRPHLLVSLLLALCRARGGGAAAAAASAGLAARPRTCLAEEAWGNRSFAALSLLAHSSTRNRRAPPRPREEGAAERGCDLPRVYSTSWPSPSGDGVSGTKYQVVRIGDAQALGRRFARPGPRNDFIFTTWQGSSDWGRFWFSHLAAVGVPQQVLMITFAPEDCEGLPAHNCVVHELGDILRLMGERAIPRDDGGKIKGGALAVVSKWIWALEFVKSGYSVLFSDADVAFVQNPLGWWDRQVPMLDVMGLSDWRPEAAPVKYCIDSPYPHHLSCQSTGIMFFRSNPRVVAVLSGMVAEASPPGRGWEQELWQPFIPQLVNDHKGSYALLPTSSFMNVEYVQPDNPKAVAIHMGYVHGGCSKMHNFWCLGLRVQGMDAVLKSMCQDQPA